MILPERSKLHLAKKLAQCIKTETGCWLWPRGVDREWGYGQFHSAGKMLKAHRASYAYHCGPIPPGMLVCHKCDVPRCVNPDHLFLGTHADNARDAAQKRRKERRPGEANPNASLTVEQVLAIRADTRTQVELAKIYGVTQAHISQIKMRKCWKHV